MSGLWLAGMAVSENARAAAQSRATQAADLVVQAQVQIREIEHQVARLALLNQALWELLRDRLKLTDQDLERLASQIDLRDGQADGKITNQAVRCPKCGRVSNSKHHKCLYCGQLFEASLFG